MEVKKIAVIGAGIMGNGIAQMAATSGYLVSVRDMDMSFVNKGFEAIKKSLTRQVKAGKITESQVEEIVSRIQGTTSLKEAVDGADFVIEAVTENFELKQNVFKELDQLCAADTIFATNTSQFSITALAAATERPEKFCGMHFFNPVPVMKLVEIARGLRTSDVTYNVVVDVCRKMGKEVVTCKDSQGFITTRLIAMLTTEAVRIMDEGIATAEDIDKACRLAFNHRMGPLETSDLTGIDTYMYVNQNLRDAYGDRFTTSQTIKNMVCAGFCGRKTGRGFYQY